jgi:hypothetical protein
MQGGGIGNRNHPRHRSSSIRYFPPAANNRWVLLLVCVVCLFRGGARANELWLSSVDPVTRAAHKWDASADYMELFHSDAKWKTVASSIRVFKIGPGFVQEGKEEDLRLIFSELQRHNIKLALEIGMVTRSEHCQQHSEAYGPQGLVEQLLRRVERLGGDLAYIAMDEPLYYGTTVVINTKVATPAISPSDRSPQTSPPTSSWPRASSPTSRSGISKSSIFQRSFCTPPRNGWMRTAKRSDSIWNFCTRMWRGRQPRWQTSNHYPLSSNRAG